MPAEFPKTIRGIREGLKRKEFSAVELTRAHLERIRERDGLLHAFLEAFEDAAEQAAAIDAGIREGRTNAPLLGVPIAVKDNILIRGKHASAGSKILENYIASYDATVIAKLRSAGAVFLGRTNMDEFAMGSSTEPSAYGATKNPHDATCVPGGSSGGSAAAVASGMAVAALGSDTGGSIRQPAAFTGVVGFKPTYGAVSRSGLIAMASSLDQIGPLARSVEDAKAVFDVIRGKDPLDATTAEQQVQNSKFKIQNFRIGVPKEYFGEGLDTDVAAAVRAAIERWQKTGAEVREISLPPASFGLAAYYIVMPAEVSANLARFDGVRYGRVASGAKTLLDVYEQSRAEGFGDEPKRRIMLGTFALSHGYYDAYYEKAERVRRLIRQDFEAAFRDVDVVVGPTAPTPAFRFGEKTDDPLQMYLADMYTVGVNLAGLPALSIPTGMI